MFIFYAACMLWKFIHERLLLPELFELDFAVIWNILDKFLSPESIKKVLLYLTPSPRLVLTILNHS